MRRFCQHRGTRYLGSPSSSKARQGAGSLSVALDASGQERPGAGNLRWKPTGPSLGQCPPSPSRPSIQSSGALCLKVLRTTGRNLRSTLGARLGTLSIRYSYMCLRVMAAITQVHTSTVQCQSRDSGSCKTCRRMSRRRPPCLRWRWRWERHFRVDANRLAVHGS